MVCLLQSNVKKAFINFPKVLIIKNRIDRLSCCKDWKSISSCDNTKSLDMIRMLMCDQNSSNSGTVRSSSEREFSIRFALTPQSTNTFVFFVPTYMQFPSLLLAKLDSFTDYTSFFSSGLTLLANIIS